MKKIFILLTITILTACGLNNSSSDRSSSSGSGTNASIDISALHLGDRFTIDRFEGEIFRNDPDSLDYYIYNIDPMGQGATGIADDLMIAIEAKHIESSINGYTLGRHTVAGDIKDKKLLIITFPISLTTDDDTSISSAYTFTINFVGEYTDVELDFYLGDNFTIPYLQKEKFRSVQKPLKYFAHRPATKNTDIDNIKKELEDEIAKVHSKNIGIKHELNHIETSDDSVSSTSKYNIVLTELADESNVIVDNYSFTILYSEPPTPVEFDFYLGDQFSISALANVPFTNIPSVDCKYILNDADRTNITNKDLIASQIVANTKMILSNNRNTLVSTTTPIILDDTTNDNQLTVQFKATLTEIGNESNNASRIYFFVITFSDEVLPPPTAELSFDLGDNFKITGTCGEAFTDNGDEDNLTYSIDNVDPTCEDSDKLLAQLKEAISTTLNNKGNINHESTNSLETFSASEAKFKIGTKISNKSDSSITKEDTYIFTMKYKTPSSSLVFPLSLGDNITIESIEEAKFQKGSGSGSGSGSERVL